MRQQENKKENFRENPTKLTWIPKVYNYAERTGNLKAEAVGVVSGEKHFPVFEDRMVFKPLTKLLIEKKLTITTMESATSGQIASLITDTEGSSAVLKGAFVTYCNEAKIMQGVPAEIIDKYTVYSTQTAEAMAKGFV